MPPKPIDARASGGDSTPGASIDDARPFNDRSLHAKCCVDLRESFELLIGASGWRPETSQSPGC
jgi:hypothetical protein